ncbi:hypothetical protein NIES2135_66270 (plasmid) [Leptolyngbya boryana NIES-2135]|uniref:Knr4/Smi1-like domain-containing protein n=2 Tax=Leptolyngbya group TaxID=3081713 RepID=A0A1Z4JST9_LEPBY|nr:MULTISPECIES: SMI1/KNR4 family protein [Leptolyngbya]MBD2370597.1 hypothetical protein [Leptolyngbya sp. FACHB-161]MBD2401387.1 hypothetical protein [Leptolyngbya sp. FACHB-239]ULP33571.1 SMI1/KNR4 family protein [Leptolyngbya boryana IU 594]BAY59750.1 hypothetical protein NIES2135_66270 [Leptolyngbya boryana NIES-2135]
MTIFPMKKLPEVGNAFLHYFQQFIPDFAEKFVPGISPTELQSVLGTLQYELPPDFYTLYEWRNGYADFNGHPDFNCYSFAPFHFNTIEMVAAEKNWDWCDDNPPTYKGYNVLPLVSCGRVFWGITLGRDYQTEAHIVYVDSVGECVLRYDSITCMMNSIVESFERGGLLLSENVIRRNDELFAETLRANNPKTLSEGIADFERYIDVYGSDTDIADYSMKMDILLNGLSILYYMKPSAILEQVRCRLNALENISSERAISAHEGLKMWLNANE